MNRSLFACSAALLLVLAGCGDKAKDGGGDTPSQMLVGIWDAKPDGAPPEVSMQVEFKAEGEVTMTMKQGAQSKTENGTWKVLSEEGQKLVMDMTINNDPKKVTATFHDTNTATLVAEGESETIALDRAK